MSNRLSRGLKSAKSPKSCFSLLTEPASVGCWKTRPASRACACVWARLGLRGVPGPVRALWPAGVRRGVCEGWERRRGDCGCCLSQVVVGRSGWRCRVSCLRVCLFSRAGCASFPRFRSLQIVVQSFGASPPVGGGGGGTRPLPAADKRPAPASASADGLCEPGDAGTRMQARNHGDVHGRSQAGSRFRHLAACRVRRQALWGL